MILELSEPTLINGIDIGNEHSCFIEVQVGNRENPDDFKELLLTSSFQTPAESRNSENTNRVRCFGKAAFVESNATKKWDLVKLNCTQPFNSRVQYGVSFVTIYSADEPKASSVPPGKEEVTRKGIFSIREASPDSDLDTNSSSLFSRWKQTKQQGGGAGGATESTAPPARVSAAAAIRDARSSIGERKSPLLLTPTTTLQARKRPSTETPVLDRNRNHLLYDSSDDEKGSDKLEKLIEKDKKRAEEQLQKKEPKKPEKKKEKPVESTPAKKFRFSENKKDEATPSRSREKDPPPPPARVKPKKPKTYKPFRKLLEGVVLTISGIQNPERGNLRSKALEMGAKYRGDWDNTCTHLICAFRNTPKYNQVQGIGKIVKRDWVLQCHANKMHIPWRRFALDSKEGEKSESEEEICDEADKEEEEEDTAAATTSTTSAAEPEEEQEKEKKKQTTEEEDDDILMVYDQVDEPPVVICDSGSDTEDEIEKVRASAAKKDAEISEKEKEKSQKKGDEEKNTLHSPSPSTGFLAGKRFYLDEDNGAIKIIKCHSIITQYGG